MNHPELRGLLDLLPFGWSISDIVLQRELEDLPVLPLAFTERRVVQTFLDVSLEWRDRSDPGRVPDLSCKVFEAFGDDFMVVSVVECPDSRIVAKCESRRVTC